MDSPTISVLSPIEKRRLLVEDSGKEVEIALTERKVCCPKDLLVSNGFKKVNTTQINLARSGTARIQLVSSDTHANANRTEQWVMFLRVNAFLSSRTVIVQKAACASQNIPKSVPEEG